jgi:radical SAM superfamily enzyme YgiQ (UPF0313 family)
LGGAHANAWKDNCFIDAQNNIDFLIYGDGEYTFLNLINALEENKELENIKGIIWRDIETGRIIDNGADEFIMNLDDIPFPDWEAVNIYKYVPTLTNYKRLPAMDVIGSRGCPFECIFCHSSRVVRKRSAKNILEEIDILVNKYGIKDITFYDETFTMFKDRTMEICDGLIKRRYDLTFSANARPDYLDRRMLRGMKEAGCWRLLFGIESGSQKVLNILKKNITLLQIRRAIKLTKECGIETHATMLFGTPGETYEEGLKTIKFACELNLDYVAFSSLAPFPGTEVFELIENPVKYDFGRLNLMKVSYVPDTMTKEELEELLYKSYQKFYLRLSYIIKRIIKMKSIDDFKKNIVGLLGFIKS